jgi:hypothetical protein
VTAFVLWKRWKYKKEQNKQQLDHELERNMNTMTLYAPGGAKAVLRVPNTVDGRQNLLNVATRAIDSGLRTMNNGGGVRGLPVAGGSGGNHYTGGSSRDARVYSASSDVSGSNVSIQNPGTKICRSEGRERPIESFVKVSSRCNHEPEDCQECVENYIGDQIEHAGWDRIKCRKQGCRKRVTRSDMERLASNNHIGAGVMER